MHQPRLADFDSSIDRSQAAQLKRPRTSSASPEHRHPGQRSPTRMDTVTSTNGALSNLPRSSPPSKLQNVRFDPAASVSGYGTQRSYLNEARAHLEKRKRGRSPPYVSPYFANPDEPPVDYDSGGDDDEPSKLSLSNSRGLHTNRTHTQIMKNVNKSLIDHNYLSHTNRSKQLDQNVRRHLRSIENQALQRELNLDLIRCFSSAYLHDLRREENRHYQTRINMRSYTYEDIQDIHMPAVLENYRMKAAVDRERRLRLTASFDGHIPSSTPTSSIGAGRLSPLLSFSSPIMTGSLNENMDVQSGGFDIDRRSQKSYTSVSVRCSSKPTAYYLNSLRRLTSSPPSRRRLPYTSFNEVYQ